MQNRFARFRPARSRSAIALPVMLGALALLSTACSSGSPAAASSSNSGSSSTTTPPRPGATGQIATLTPPSMEVQDPQSGQTTVSWTSSTTFTEQVTGSLSDVASGDCVTVTGTPAASGSSTSPITARSITITQSNTDGTCPGPGSGTGAGGFPGGFAQRPSGSSGGGFTPPSGGTFPGGGSIPSGGSIPQFATATGKVVSTGGSGLVVNGVERNGFGRRGSSTSTTTTTTPKNTDITITTDSSTTVNKTVSSAASALSVGQCVTAIGTADSTGAVTADSVSIRQPVNGSCSGGFFGGGAPGGGGSSSA